MDTVKETVKDTKASDKEESTDKKKRMSLSIARENLVGKVEAAKTEIECLQTQIKEKQIYVGALEDALEAFGAND